MAKDKEYNRLIHTTRWLRLRREVLTRYPLCQRCYSDGMITPASEVHHIRPVEEAVGYVERERLMYDATNLQALCHDCHVKTHTEMGRCGKEANKARTIKQVNAIINKFFL